MEDAYLSQGVGEVEAMAAAGTAEHDLIPYWSPADREGARQAPVKPSVRVDHVFWRYERGRPGRPESGSAPTLAQLVAELAVLAGGPGGAGQGGGGPGGPDRDHREPRHDQLRLLAGR